MDDRADVSPPPDAQPDDRLDSWKAIAAYLKRDVTTVQRWERREGMPVHRHLHDKLGSVYAFRAEIDAWLIQRAPHREPEPSDADPGAQATVERPRPDPASQTPASVTPAPTRRRVSRAVIWLLTGMAAAGIGLAVLMEWPSARPEHAADPFASATFHSITDFDGTENAAAISRDGQFVAFLSDRDGRMDVWVTPLATGQFYNLTRGRVRELVNASVRTLGFTADGAFVTFWARGVEGAQNDDIGIWAIPTLGGAPKPFLEGAAEYDEASDNGRLVYHTPEAGDPLFVRGTDGAAGRRIYSAARGLHAHFPTWSPDGRFIYFVQGTPPEAMDIYRIAPDGTGLTRITHHQAAVSHPVFVDDRTLAYLSRLPHETGGARLYTLDLTSAGASPRALGSGFDRYASLSASSDGRRLVATLASPKSTLWRLPIGEATSTLADASPITLPTGRGSQPRLGPGYLLYVAKKGADDGLWKLVDGDAAEIWAAPDTRVVGGPALDHRHGRIALTTEKQGRTAIYVMTADGSQARVLTDRWTFEGPAAWAPDGLTLTSAVVVDGKPQLFQFPLDGEPRPLVKEFAAEPAWAPTGDFVVYSAEDIGTVFAVRAVTASGAPVALPPLTLPRGARRLRFVANAPAVVFMRGDLRHKDLWLMDLGSGAERRLTALPLDFSIRDFDISVDGREVVVERVQEHSDIVRIDRAQGDPR